MRTVITCVGSLGFFSTALAGCFFLPRFLLARFERLVLPEFLEHLLDLAVRLRRFKLAECFQRGVVSADRSPEPKDFSIERHPIGIVRNRPSAACWTAYSLSISVTRVSFRLTAVVLDRHSSAWMCGLKEASHGRQAGAGEAAARRGPAPCESKTPRIVCVIKQTTRRGIFSKRILE